MIKTRKQSSTDYPINFLMVDSSDHVTGKTGLTPTVTISKNGGSFAAVSGTVSEIGNGWYKLSGNATDRNTLGDLLIHVTAAGADPADILLTVVKHDPFDLATPTNITSATGIQLADGAITAAKIASSAITDAKIASNAITEAKIFNGAITADKIASKAIRAWTIADDAYNKIAGLVAQATSGATANVITNFIAGEYPNIIVSEAASRQGTYIYRGMYDGRPLYVFVYNGINIIFWDSNYSRWNIGIDNGGVYTALWYYSEDDVATPDLCTTWKDFEGGPPLPVLTAAPDTSLYAQLAAIRGAGWTSESLKAIADAIDLIDGGLDETLNRVKYPDLYVSGVKSPDGRWQYDGLNNEMLTYGGMLNDRPFYVMKRYTPSDYIVKFDDYYGTNRWQIWYDDKLLYVHDYGDSPTPEDLTTWYGELDADATIDPLRSFNTILNDGLSIAKYPPVVVNGVSTQDVNGVYEFYGFNYENRPKYIKRGTMYRIISDNFQWFVTSVADDGTFDEGYLYTEYNSDADFPYIETDWKDSDSGQIVPEASVKLYIKGTLDAIKESGGGLDAAGVRTAVGLAAANLDAQLSGIASDAGDVESRLTSARAGYIDKLNVAGTLANTNNADTFKADVSGLMTAAAYTAPNNADISAIKAKTDNLPNNPAATSDIPAADITAIKAKTDNLPATPAAKGDEMKLENGAITAAKIATDAITADKIAYAAITVNKIQDGAITANKIASNAIAAAKIADGAITGDKVAASAVTKIQSGLAVPGSAMTLTSAYDNAKDDVLTPLATVDGKADAIKAKTDNLPGSPAATGDKMMLDTNALDAAAIKADAVTKLQANLALEATLTAIKGAGWSTETLKAIKDAVDAIDLGGGGGGATAQEVWEYATRSLSNPNDYKADLTSVEGKVDAIKAKTDNLPVSPAATGDIPAADIAAIKAKTDKIPNSPAAAGDAMTLTSAYDHAKDDVLTPLGVTDGKVDAIKTKTDNLPNNPAAKTDIPTADISAIKAKTDNLPLSPAATGDAMTLDGAYDHAKDDVLTPLFNLDGKVSGLNDIDSAEVKAQIDAALHTDKLPDSYSVVGAQPSIAQALLEIRQWLTQKNIVGITMTVKKPDGTTDAMTFGLDDPANPTKIVRLS